MFINSGRNFPPTVPAFFSIQTSRRRLLSIHQLLLVQVSMRSAPVTSGIKEIYRPADQASYSTREDAILDADHEDLLLAASLVHEAREHACSNNFWKSMEIFFAPVTVEDLLFLKYQLDQTTKLKLGEYNPNQEISKMFASIDDDFLMGGTELQSKLDMEFQNYFLERLSCGRRALSPDEKSPQELQSLGLSCNPVVDDEVLIDAEIRRLEEVRYQHAANVKKILEKVVAPVQCELQCKKRSLEKSAMDQLVQMSYKKLTRTAFLKKEKKKKVKKPAPDGSSSDALDFARRTLARCRQFEASGKSCFRESHLQEIIFNSSPRKIVAESASDLQVRKDAKQNGSRG